MKSAVGISAVSGRLDRGWVKSKSHQKKIFDTPEGSQEEKTNIMDRPVIRVEKGEYMQTA